MTVNGDGVVQQNPDGETCSQLPPVADTATDVNANAEPVLAIASVCGSGSAPPNGLVKLRALPCSKTLSPIVTLIGTVMLSPAVWNRSWPVKTPATWPPFGRFAATIPTVTNEGAVPDVPEILSQLPPLKVLPTSVQFKAPVPALRTWSVWVEKLVPPVLV